MAHALQLTLRAYADIDVLFAHVKRRSGVTSAERWRDALFARLSVLEHQPGLWPLADEADLAASGLREFHFRRWRHVYRIFYRIDENVVRIHRIRHAAQDRLTPEDL